MPKSYWARQDHARMLRVRLAAGEFPEPDLAAIAQAVVVEAEQAERVTQAVANCRVRGRTWRQIAKMMGISWQAARSWYRL